MKHLVVPQGSAEWFAARRGIPTASVFDQIVTPTGKFSEQSTTLMHRLIAEIITGEDLHSFAPSFWMERGAQFEADAAALYEFETGHALEPGGIMLDDELRWGASPDRLVVSDGQIIGGVEIKCPAPWTHVANLLMRAQGAIDRRYIPQVQGQILVGGLQFVDWFSYHPDMPPALIRTEPDPRFQERLAEGLEQFHNRMQAALDQLVEIGALAERPRKTLPETPPDGIEAILSRDPAVTPVAMSG